MTKKPRSPAKKANSFGSMGRILFYSVALIVACCAVAVVLFETEAGLEIVAKVRGRRTPSTRADGKPTFSETRHSEGETNKDSVEAKKKEQTKSDESALPREGSVLKDTSAKPSDNTHEAQSSDSRNDRESNEARQESTASESTSETAKENTRQYEKPRVEETTSETVSGYPTNEKETWEILNEDEQEQDKPVEEEDKPLEEPDKPVEKPVFKENFESESENDVGQKVGEKEEHEFSEEKEMNEEHHGKVGESEHSKSEEVDESVEQQQEGKSGNKDVKQEVDGGKMEEDETIKVGDSLAELEKQRTKEQQIKEERYDPIPEPEGPPIDQSPVNARRGLRGDYGGKGNMKFYKLFWQGLFECVSHHKCGI